MPRWLPFLTVPLFAVLALIGAFAWVDYRAIDLVAPDVELAGRPVGEMNPDELFSAVDEVAQEFEATPVTIRFAGRTIETTARHLGLHVDRQATQVSVFGVGKRDGFLDRLVSWLATLTGPRRVDPVRLFDASMARSFLEAKSETVVGVPIEPAVKLVDGEFIVIAGVEGLELDRDATVGLLEAAFTPERSMTVDAPTTSEAPILSNTEAVAFAERLNSLTEGGIAAEVGGEVGRLSEETLRKVIDIEGWPDSPSFSFDSGLLRERLFRLFSHVVEPGTDPVLEVVDGVPRVEEVGAPARACCDAAAGELIVEALEAGEEETVRIPTIGTPDEEGWSRGEGVVELVGEFTTEHACCQNRVENIHRIADLVRGVYLTPGERFSVNEFVGRRTREKGFVADGVIEQGRFTEAVGGGISQFATTFFNAAFFGGLELEEYQSHSIYISRYPYGREATLSFPKPDLVVRNTTEYPVLIWSSYDDTSITMSLYSTKHIEVEQIEQIRRGARRCTQVETIRSRTYPDGRVLEDSVMALYRPGEGLDCNGNPTPVRN